MGEYAEKFKKWAGRFGVEFIPDEPKHKPTPIRESDGLPVGSIPVHQLPNTWNQMQEQEESDSTASVWATILCGGKVRTRPPLTATELYNRNMGDAERAWKQKWGSYLQLDCREGRPTVKPVPLVSSQRDEAVRQMREAHEKLRRQGLDLA
jgi:hypothetical protein